MRMRRVMTIGIVAGALAVSACGTAVSSSGAIPAGHPASTAAWHAPAAAGISDRDSLAQVKRHLVPPSGDPEVQRPQAGIAPFTDQADLARLKREVASRAARQAQGG